MPDTRVHLHTPSPSTTLPPGGGETLLAIARTSIASRLGVAAGAAPATDETAWLREPAASFVSLHRGEDLRGCIGSLEPTRPLVEDVRANALAAAFADPRFPPLRAAELEGVAIEVSVLSPTRPLPPGDEESVLANLEPGMHGVVLRWGHRRATFLPQVWESLPEPRRFLAALKLKAGIDADLWYDDLRVETYTVSLCRESG